MGYSACAELLAGSMEEKAQKDSIAYIASHLKRFVKQRDKVLICFPDHEKGNISYLMEQAVLACGAVPVLWGNDHRWKSLLQLAFFSRASVIIGPPLIILGLTKLRKHNGIPLYIRHVVTAGYPCLDWMIEGIVGGLDCSSWGCFGIGMTGAVTGFSCGHSLGVHIRDDVYRVEVVDETDTPRTDGKLGRIAISRRESPDMRYVMGECARLEHSPCTCGCSSPRLVDIQPGETVDAFLYDLGQYLQSWTSVLDCRVEKREYGLELELVVFPGEKLPKLPSVARQIIRPWDPKHDEPFFYVPGAENSGFSAEKY